MATAVVPRDVLVAPGTKSLDPAAADQETRVLPSQERLEENSFHIRIILVSGHLQAVPQRVLFGALRHPLLKLRHPIPLHTERSERGVSVVWEEGQEFGHGDTFSSALDDFAQTIAELYLRLSSMRESLSGDLLQVREKLSHYIETRDR